MAGESESTLGRRAGSDATAPEVAQFAREQARIAAEVAIGGNPGRRVEALNRLADYIGSLPQHDQRIRSLWVLHGTSGPEFYEPGENQRTLFSLLGADGPAPPTDETLNELVSVAIEDSVAASGEKQAESRREADQALAQVAAAEAAQASAAADSEELQRLRVEVEELRVALTSKEEQVEFLSSALGGGDRRHDAAPESRRRTKHPDHVGVYYTDRASGRVFEIAWRDADGKQRWRTIGGDLDEAVKARAEVTEEVEEGAAA